MKGLWFIEKPRPYVRRVKSIFIRPLFLPFSFSLWLVLFHDQKLLLLEVKIFQKDSFSVKN